MTGSAEPMPNQQHLALVDVAPLMLEALEAAEEVARLQRPFVDGINRGSTASQEVIQEASDRLAAAQRRWWDLRIRALAAARRAARASAGAGEATP
jgi:hypothetical protein